MPDKLSKLELLAPAGGPKALFAAVEAGADAVYFGLKELNARRGAENFTQDNLAENVGFVHGRGAKAYLALNIDVSQRELGEAARQLELARQCKVDAVLVKDPAILKMMPYFPGIDFHFSTQAGISSSAGVRAARELGIKRVVLARELSIDEIRAASSVEGVETEVFVQGALCFCMSGYCLLSSWLGGRSGNRGLCASPCRFEWKIGSSGGGRFLSMHDLSLLERLEDLQQAGARALKIEGRLKSPEWISKAVSVYRRGIDNGVDDQLRKEVLELGEYTGRSLTDGYLKGCRRKLTGDSGRISTVPEELEDAVSQPESEPAAEPDGTYGIDIKIENGRLACVFSHGGSSRKYLYPVSLVRSPERAVALGAVGEMISEVPVQGLLLGNFSVEDGDMQMPRNILKKLREDLSSFLRLARKGGDEKIKVRIPVDVQSILDGCRNEIPDNPNKLKLGGGIDVVRIPGYGDACEFRRKCAGYRIIIDGAGSHEILNSDFEWGRSLPVIALPPVFFEDDIVRVRALLDVCKERGLAVEVNSWDGWFLAREAGARLEAGPGMAVLNSIAAGFLNEKGCGSAVVSLEADKRQMEDIASRSFVPLRIYSYGRPVLMVSRAELPPEFTGKVFQDRRNCSMRLGLEWNLSVFRPTEPFDLRREVKGGLVAAGFAADLSGSGDFSSELKRAGSACGSAVKTFNYLRKLR
ncbi:MAG: peptidase U32 family protein [Victivallales bacterium]